MRKPGSRAELEEQDLGPLVRGFADPLRDEESSKGQTKAVLWVPDIEARHYWREYYIRAEDKPGPKYRTGFRP